MSTTTYVIARDPHPPSDLFDAACRAAGAPERGKRHDFGGVGMLQSHGTAATVSVHYSASGINAIGRTTVP